MFALVIQLSLKAQTHLPVITSGYALWSPFPAFNPFYGIPNSNQKFYFNTYSGVSAGYSYYNGAGASYLSVPLGVQLTHPLNNNIYAFAGASIGPTLYNLNQSVPNPYFNSSYPGGAIPNTYGMGLNSRVELGLMYMNDAKTFSISGSIGVERSSFPVYPSNRPVTKRP